MESAILREKALKARKRIWKIQLIEGANAGRRDLYPDILPSTRPNFRNRSVPT